jgi:hypothetical protein
MYATLQEFLAHTEAITYIVIFIILFSITGFWLFLSGKDEDYDS